MWISESEKLAYKKFFQKQNNYMLKGKPEITKQRAILNNDNRKLAYITQGKTTIVAYVDNQTNKAYRTTTHYIKTWMEIKTFNFVRWIRPMDV
jgi:hypothetical protein